MLCTSPFYCGTEHVAPHHPTRRVGCILFEAHLLPTTNTTTHHTTPLASVAPPTHTNTHHQHASPTHTPHTHHPHTPHTHTHVTRTPQTCHTHQTHVYVYIYITTQTETPNARNNSTRTHVKHMRPLSYYAHHNKHCRNHLTTLRESFICPGSEHNLEAPIVFGYLSYLRQSLDVVPIIAAMRRSLDEMRQVLGVFPITTATRQSLEVVPIIVATRQSLYVVPIIAHMRQSLDVVPIIVATQVASMRNARNARSFDHHRAII